MRIKKFFKEKNILITGHTGFKGSWLAKWIIKNQGKVFGISKNIPTNPSHYVCLNLKRKMEKEFFFDLKNKEKLHKTISNIKPDYIFHLAAQAIVKKSYKNPFETWQSNTISTLNLLECLRKIKKKTQVVIITSDKSYKNLELNRGYVENDLIGGDDPYSASKGATEILLNSYIRSFFFSKKNKVRISIARAGNVIGGGDWSEDRLIPDCVRSWSKNKSVILRNPKSTRPWQHVMDVLYGYILLAINLKINAKKVHGEAFNFGPSIKNKLTVLKLVKKMGNSWKKVKFKKIIKNKRNFKESKLLQLNSKKAKKYLNWSCRLNTKKTIDLVTLWYKDFYSKKRNKDLTINQLDFFENLLKK